MIDDATSELFAFFYLRDTGLANRQVLTRYLSVHGRMGALYVDRASHFGNWRSAHGSRKAGEDADPVMVNSLIRRGLEQLEIELILALSAQAKGRVERLFGTLQDRLIKEMRIAGVSSLEEANHFLWEVFIPFWNRRFTVVPAEAIDAHRPLPLGCGFERAFRRDRDAGSARRLHVSLSQCALADRGGRRERAAAQTEDHHRAAAGRLRALPLRRALPHAGSLRRPTATIAAAGPTVVAASTSPPTGRSPLAEAVPDRQNPPRGKAVVTLRCAPGPTPLWRGWFCFSPTPQEGTFLFRSTPGLFYFTVTAVEGVEVPRRAHRWGRQVLPDPREARAPASRWCSRSVSKLK